MDTNKKGNLGLINVMKDLLEKGYFVFSPLSDTTCVDLVVANEQMELRTVQVKYISLRNGALNLCTSTVVNGKKTPIDLKKIDFWAIYCPDNNKVYYVSSNFLLGKKSLTLRILKSKKTKNLTTHIADNYLSIEDVWRERKF